MNLVLEPNDTVYFIGRAAILVFALLAFALAFTSWRRALRRDLQRLFGELEQSQAETRLLQTATAANFERLSAHLGALENKIDTRAQLTAASAGSPRGYELALRLARNGASMEEITESSGVTRQEAQLLARLHGPRRSA
jgi:hypothetical protein